MEKNKREREKVRIHKIIIGEERKVWTEGRGEEARECEAASFQITPLQRV